MFVNLKLDLASNIESVPKIMVQFCFLWDYIRHQNCFLSSVATWQGLRNGHGLKLEKDGLTFSMSFNAVSTKITKKLLWLELPDEI